MGKFIDRDLQMKILRLAAENFPKPTPKEHLTELAESEVLIRNLAYLEGHGLLSNALTKSSGKRYIRRPTITSAGIDLAEGDGGLEAISRD